LSTLEAHCSRNQRAADGEHDHAFEEIAEEIV
jgi:hypothetical protein